MKISIGVENFGKIHSALVDVSNYTLFVGENNSGKTYLMQLIYYLLGKYRIRNESNLVESNSIADKLRSDGSILLSRNDFLAIQNDINRDLEENKHAIVKGVFNREVNIDRLYIEIEQEENDEISVTYKDMSEAQLDPEVVKVIKEIRDTINNGIEIREICIDNKRNGVPYRSYSVFSEISNKEIINLIMGSVLYNRSGLFIPASRTGLLMLFRNFFAETVDAVRSGKTLNGEIELTTPVYEFLRFLQTINYKEEQNNELIEFAENNIIDGHLIMKKDEPIRYVDKKDKVIPLVLSSSMVNEVTPILQSLVSTREMQYLIIDEIETSLHPKKQKEMARFLNRVNNAGYRLVVSTHSDTMAAYVNNFHILSKKNLKSDELKEMNLLEEDLLKTGEIRYYEFKNMDDGTSKVEALEFGQYPNDGVDFKLFAESADELYSNSMKILEMKG